MSADIQVSSCAKVNSLLITLDKDLPAEEAEGIINLLYNIRNVLDVKVNVVSISDYVATQRVKQELRTK